MSQVKILGERMQLWQNNISCQKNKTPVSRMKLGQKNLPCQKNISCHKNKFHVARINCLETIPGQRMHIHYVSNIHVTRMPLSSQEQSQD